MRSKIFSVAALGLGLFALTGCHSPVSVSPLESSEEHVAYATGGKWNKTTISWKYTNTTTLTFAQPGESWDTVFIRSAALMWSAYAKNLNIYKNSGSADIVINYGGTSSNTTTAAKTTMTINGGIISGPVTIQLYQKYSNGTTINWNADKGMFFFRTISHELGHAIGLNDASTGSTMYPTYSKARVFVNSDDKAGLTSLYGTSSQLAIYAFFDPSQGTMTSHRWTVLDGEPQALLNNGKVFNEVIGISEYQVAGTNMSLWYNTVTTQNCGSARCDTTFNMTKNGGGSRLGCIYNSPTGLSFVPLYRHHGITSAGHSDYYYSINPNKLWTDGTLYAVWDIIGYVQMM